MTKSLPVYRWSLRSMFVVVLGMCSLFAAAFWSPVSAEVGVLKARIGVHASHTRFVLELTDAVPYRILTLADPFRIVIDLPEAEWRGGKTPEAPPGSLIGGLRYGLFKHGVSRVVIDLNQPASIVRQFLLDADASAGYRIVVDVSPTDAANFRANIASIESEGWKDYAAAQASRQHAEIESSTPVAPGDEDKPVIVIDAGHGGVDPGAIGRTGVYEKAIVLLMARELNRQLKATGRYRTVLTRDKDIYIPLRNRFEIAHKAEGDLFLSLHVNTHKSRDLRGFSVYTLSETASDKEAAALAAKENKSDVLAGYDLSGYDEQTAFILLDLAQRDTSKTSWRFAQTLVTSLRGDKIRMLRKPHRFAGFAVLKSPTVPSVLIEVGYLSNKNEERQLKSRDYQKRIAAGIVKAIDGFFETEAVLSRS